jgi:hypothetical protein
MIEYSGKINEFEGRAMPEFQISELVSKMILSKDE